MRVEANKKLACLRRSPVSVRKLTVSPALTPPYQRPAGFSQTYKDHLYANDPYQQSYERPVAATMTTEVEMRPTALTPEQLEAELDEQQPVPLPQAWLEDPETH